MFGIKDGRDKSLLFFIIHFRGILKFSLLSLFHFSLDRRMSLIFINLNQWLWLNSLIIVEFVLCSVRNDDDDDDSDDDNDDDDK